MIVIGYGTNESKDIVNSSNTLKTVAKFKNYLDQAKSQLEIMGAVVIMANPDKGCPAGSKNYEPGGMLKTLAQGIVSWYPGAADVYTPFDNYYCADQSACPGPDACDTRCLINVSPYNSPGFPDRTCGDDYAHPNQTGYNLMAQAIGDVILSLELCQTPTPTPTPAYLCFGPDSVINTDDAKTWVANYLKTTMTNFDLNSDNKFNSFELGYLYFRWGTNCHH